MITINTIKKSILGVVVVAASYSGLYGANNGTGTLYGHNRRGSHAEQQRHSPTRPSAGAQLTTGTHADHALNHHQTHHEFYRKRTSELETQLEESNARSTALNEQLAEQKRKADADLAAATAAHAQQQKTRQELEAQLAAAKDAAQQAAQDHATKLAAAQKDYDARITAYENGARKTTQQLIDRHTQAMNQQETLANALTTNLKRQANEHSKALSALRDDHAQALKEHGEHLGAEKAFHNQQLSALFTPRQTWGMVAAAAVITFTLCKPQWLKSLATAVRKPFIATGFFRKLIGLRK